MLSTGNRNFLLGSEKAQSSVQSVVTVGLPSCAETARPFTGGVKHTQHLHNVAAYTIRNDVWSAGYDQFAGSGHPSRSASSGKSLQTLDRLCNRRHGPGRSVGIVLGDVLDRPTYECAVARRLSFPLSVTFPSVRGTSHSACANQPAALPMTHPLRRPEAH